MNNATLPDGCSQPGSYLLDNAAKQAPARFGALSAMFDASTIRHLEDRGIGPGWHCLEVGGGGGSVARWLSTCVGEAGRVLVTDIDTRFLRDLSLSNLEVLRHDIVRDPLPENAFDLVHARLVLVHVPEKEKVLEKLIAALKPGGWLVDEEFDSLSVPPDPAVSPGEVVLPTHVAMGRLMADRGFERRWGRLLCKRFRENRLVEVGAEGRMFMAQCGSPAAALLRANFEQLHEGLIAAHYITAQQFEDDLARLEYSDFMMPSSILWTAWGRRPPV